MRKTVFAPRVQGDFRRMIRSEATASSVIFYLQTLACRYCLLGSRTSPPHDNHWDADVQRETVARVDGERASGEGSSWQKIDASCQIFMLLCVAALDAVGGSQLVRVFLSRRSIFFGLRTADSKAEPSLSRSKCSGV